MHRSNVQLIADRLINDYKFYAIQCSLANIKPFGKIEYIYTFSVIILLEYSVTILLEFLSHSAEIQADINVPSDFFL